MNYVKCKLRIWYLIEINTCFTESFQCHRRDQEYLEHSSLWGHQYVAGGAGEGAQRLKPDGSGRNVQVVKSDAVLPAYCNPPNPCPVGYTGRYSTTCE